jgi:hypothetical protein
MKYLTILLLIAGAIACSSSEQVINETLEEAKENFQTESKNLPSNLSLESLRTQLSDAYTYRDNKIPEAFNRVKVEEKVERDLYEGYRIQIYSGQSVIAADTLANLIPIHFSELHIIGYTLVIFTSENVPSHFPIL